MGMGAAGRDWIIDDRPAHAGSVAPSIARSPSTGPKPVIATTDREAVRQGYVADRRGTDEQHK